MLVHLRPVSSGAPGLHGTHAQETHGRSAALFTGSGAGGPCPRREACSRAPSVQLQRWSAAGVAHSLADADRVEPVAPSSRAILNSRMRQLRRTRGSVAVAVPAGLAWFLHPPLRHLLSRAAHSSADLQHGFCRSDWQSRSDYSVECAGLPLGDTLVSRDSKEQRWEHPPGMEESSGAGDHAQD